MPFLKNCVECMVLWIRLIHLSSLFSYIFNRVNIFNLTDFLLPKYLYHQVPWVLSIKSNLLFWILFLSNNLSAPLSYSWYPPWTWYCYLCGFHTRFNDFQGEVSVWLCVKSTILFKSLKFYMWQMVKLRMYP